MIVATAPTNTTQGARIRRSTLLTCAPSVDRPTVTQAGDGAPA
jgi:hypothetical protein